MALLLVASLWIRQPVERGDDLFGVVPADAFLVVDIDVEGLSKTEVGRGLLGRGRQAVGAKDVRAVCGLDPLRGVRRMAIAIPGEGSRAGFGLFALGALNRDGLLACAERFIVAQGGKPERRSEGSFVVIRDTRGAVSAAEIAIDDHGRLIIAEGPYLRQSIAAARGDRASLRSEGGAHQMNEKIGKGELRMSAVFSAAQHHRLLRMLQERGDARGVLTDLEAVAGRMRFADPIEVDARVSCRSATACQAVAQRVESTRNRMLGSPMTQVLGISRILQEATVELNGSEVRLSLRASLADVGLVLERLRAFEAMAQPSSSSSSTAAPRAPAASATTSSAPSSSSSTRDALAPRVGGP